MKVQKVSKKAEMVQKEAASNASSARKRDRGLTEESLIQSATEIFSKLGFDAATTKLISRKAKVNESLIMRYFGGKEGLLVEIIRRFFEEIHGTPLNYPPQDSLEAELTHFVRQSFEMTNQHKEIIRIMLLRASVDPKMKKKVLSFLNTEGDPRLIERIRLLKEKSKLPAHLDPVLIHLTAFYNISAIFLAELLFDRDKQLEIEKNLEKLVAYTVKGLISS